MQQTQGRGPRATPARTTPYHTLSAKRNAALDDAAVFPPRRALILDGLPEILAPMRRPFRSVSAPGFVTTDMSALMSAALFTLAVLAPLGTARANDTSVTLGAGGLTAERSGTVRMKSERLYLSPKLVRVDYEMENTGDTPVETLVAFPLPRQNAAELVNEPVIVHTRDRENFVDFKLSIDGKEVSTEREARAFLLEGDHKEVTEQLRPLGLLDSPVRASFYQSLEALPREQQQSLERAGLLEIDRSDAERPTLTPLWELRVSYFWKQIFPPRTVVRVHHEYAPVVGFGYFGAFTFEDERKPWCIDEGTEAAINKLISAQKPHEGSDKLLSRRQIDYVLSTGANWAGPIGTFELTIDKESPQNILSLCLSDLKKTGPTTFQVTKHDFTPSADLSLIVLGPYKAVDL